MLLKICGITRKEDLFAAEEAGADYAGFILVPGSPRRISPEAAGEMIRSASCGTVCVVRDMPLDELNDAIAFLRPDIVQLHGSETPEYAAGIAGAEVWKAVRMESESDLREALAFPCARIVADSGGGTGKRCRWDLASRLAAERSVFLAGGITPENVREAAGAVRPAGIDVSGGVEASPGIKDHRKIQLLAERIRQ